jgi:hypothetical protein
MLTNARVPEVMLTGGQPAPSGFLARDAKHSAERSAHCSGGTSSLEPSDVKRNQSAINLLDWCKLPAHLVADKRAATLPLAHCHVTLKVTVEIPIEAQLCSSSANLPTRSSLNS